MHICGYNSATRLMPNVAKVVFKENYLRIVEGKGEMIETPGFESDELQRADLQHWVKRACREFYLRPSYLWKRIRRLSSLNILRVSVKRFAVLLRSIAPEKKGK